MEMIKKSIRGIALIFSVAWMFSCDQTMDYKDTSDQLDAEITKIDQYLDQQGSIPFKHIDGIRIRILEMGTGLPAGSSSTVDVDYTGRLFDTGVAFDAGTARGPLSSYIDGWKLAFTSLPAGTRAILYIPSFFGYGANGKGSIPPDATLIFDVVFNEVVKSSTELQRLTSDTVAIDTYLEQKNIDAVKDTTGLRYVVTQQGVGVTPTWHSKVSYKASFKLLTADENVVVSFEGRPNENTNSLIVDQVADGIKLGLMKLSAGGKATLYVPSGLGFGANGATSGGQVVIPPNANLIIDLELLEVSSL